MQLCVIVCGGKVSVSGGQGDRLAGGSLEPRALLSASHLAGPVMLTLPISLSSVMEPELSSHPLIMDMLDASLAESSSLAWTLDFLAGVLSSWCLPLRSFVVPVLRLSKI